MATTAVFDHEKVKPLDLDTFDPDKNYRAKVALGFNQKWRKFNGGYWEQQPELERGGKVKLAHRPAVHETGVVSGDIMRGLATHHNDWLEANRTRTIVQGTDSTNPQRKNETRPVSEDGNPLYKGDIARMFLVLEYKPTMDPLTDGSNVTVLDAVRTFIHETVSATVSAVLKQTAGAK